MQKKFPFIFAVCLLISLSGCLGSQSKSDQATEPGQTPQELEVAPIPPNVTGTSKPSTVPSSPKANPTAEKVTPAESQSKPASKSPAIASKTPPAKKAVVKDTPVPKLSPENEKLVSKITKEVKEEADFETQNFGMTTVNRLLLAQQAMWLISGSFSTDFKALEPNLPMETDEYRFEITQGDQSEAVVVAIAKSDKLPSFAGTAVAVPTKTPKIGLCRTKLPSQTAPTPPKIDQDQVQCGNDGVIVADVNS